jgi:mRNA interferase RelE/StbE
MENSGFEILYHPHVSKDLRSLSGKEKSTFFAIVNNIISSDPFKDKKLKGIFLGLYKFRFGSYRIIYKIDSGKKIVYILRVRYRKEAYDNFC